MRRVTSAAIALVLSACRPGDEPGAESSSTSARGRATAAATTTAEFPAVGVAVLDSASWCAAFPDGDESASLAPGQAVAIVYTRAAAVPARMARVRHLRSTPCPTAFGQLRWEGYAAYDLELTDSLPLDAASAPIAALVVASAARWTRGANGRVRADLDGDGVPEEARSCTADEGEHFTLWSVSAPASRRRRAHEYFDWGALTEPTCGPGERGESEET